MDHRSDQSKFTINPYLPSWEYVPDAEPHCFDGRVYVYGSHDRFNGHAYCLNDYVCWSAPQNDLTDWRYEGVIYKKTDDPYNPDGRMCLYAPDVTRGPDGRYYLFYVLDKVPVVSVAVCDKPAGKYTFYGYVHYKDGTLLGEAPGDEPQFDPAVLTEGSLTYLYTGFCPSDDPSRSGPMVTVLGPDMLEIIESPRFIAPSKPFSKGSGYEGHEFFEAPSIRKYKGLYYFVYSSVVFHELCYAVSSSPTEGFQYKGVLVSNCDLHIDSYKPSAMPMYYGGNNHGGLLELDNSYYIFYHRHTNGTNFSRQACAEPIQLLENGEFLQAEMTSCGLNISAFPGKGEYPAHMACNLFCGIESVYTGSNAYMDNRFPKITQDECDGNSGKAYIANMMDGASAGFKYFNFINLQKISIRVRGYCKGCFEVRTSWDGPLCGTIEITDFTNVWTEYTGEIHVPDGIHGLYFRYSGQGIASLLSFTLM
ncbi:family 43 glycosylhydrolase [Spirochaeta dissipatitropha]